MQYHSLHIYPEPYALYEHPDICIDMECPATPSVATTAQPAGTSSGPSLLTLFSLRLFGLNPTLMNVANRPPPSCSQSDPTSAFKSELYTLTTPDEEC